MNPLHPCPFCGSAVKDVVLDDLGNKVPALGVRRGSRLLWVRCQECKAEGPAGKDELTATALWNVRLGL